MNTMNPIDRVLTQVRKVVLGYESMTELVAYAMLADGHAMLTGVPGLAKSVTANAFRKAIREASSSRFQMTPNTMPSDIVGSEVLNRKTNEFEVRLGKIFANIVLADEINRTSPRTQAALLEAMAEKSTSIAGTTYKMPDLFCVLATRNPLEQEGTYPLPEAQLDRFLFEMNMPYAPREAEKQMLRQQNILRGKDPYAPIDNTQSLSVEEMLALREVVRNVHVSDAALEYILSLVRTTRPDEKEFKDFLSKNANDADVQKFGQAMEVGGSPRAEQALLAASQVRAFHMGRDYVLPEDLLYILFPVLGHRIIFNRRAKMDKKYKTVDAITTLGSKVEFHKNLKDYEPNRS